MSQIASVADPPRGTLTLMQEVASRTPGDSRLEMCIQCGTCGGSCPSANAMDHTPRAIFAMLRAGMREEVFRSNTPWMCVSCYYCTVRCPQQIHITDVMYTLKNMALEAGIVPDRTASDFSKLFISYVENFGRSFEIGLAGVQTLTHPRLARRLPAMAPLAIGMLFKRGVSPLPPKRIRGLADLKKILRRAKELEAA